MTLDDRSTQREGATRLPVKCRHQHSSNSLLGKSHTSSHYEKSAQHQRSGQGGGASRTNAKTTGNRGSLPIATAVIGKRISATACARVSKPTTTIATTPSFVHRRFLPYAPNIMFPYRNLSDAILQYNTPAVLCQNAQNRNGPSPWRDIGPFIRTPNGHPHRPHRTLTKRTMCPCYSRSAIR